jgi:hypothetical protein
LLLLQHLAHFREVTDKQVLLAIFYQHQSIFVHVVLSGCRAVVTVLQPLLYLYMLLCYASQIRNQPKSTKINFGYNFTVRQVIKQISLSTISFP